MDQIYPKRKYFVGIEGGASMSKVVLVRDDGKILASIEDGPSTNPWLIGEPECQRRLIEMIENVKELARLQSDTVLDGLGLCLSGCESEIVNSQFKRSFLQKYPNITRSCSIESDTVGSILTATPSGGIVIIAGTGSNCLLLDSKGKRFKCGGWGYMLGDEGSAFWISKKCIKTLIDHDEGYRASPFSIHAAKKIIFDYFKIESIVDILKHTYANFDKSFYAGVCTQLAAEAFKGDPLLRDIFDKAGQELAIHVNTVLGKIDMTSFNRNEPLVVACVGSVFKSWPLMEEGFLSMLKDCDTELNLVTLRRSAAIGAAYLAARNSGFLLPIDFRENVNVLKIIRFRGNNRL